MLFQSRTKDGKIFISDSQTGDILRDADKGKDEERLKDLKRQLAQAKQIGGDKDYEMELEEEIEKLQAKDCKMKDSKTTDEHYKDVKKIPNDPIIKNQIKIAKKTLKMPPAMLGVMGGGMSKEEAKKLLEKYGIKTTDSLYKGQKVTAIKSEEGLREGETYTVIRGEKPITQSSEAEVKTVYVLQDSSGNLVTVSGCEDLFYRTEDANPIYSVRKNLRTGAIEYDKGGRWLPIEGKIKEAFENEQYIFSRTDKEGYAHYTVQVMDSADTFTKGEALKVKIGEIQKNMDAARKMGYDTAQYQKEIDKLQEDSDIQESVVSELKRKGFKEWKRQYGEVFLSIGSKKLGTTYAQVDENGKIGGFSLQDFLRLPMVVNQISIGDDKDFKYKEENDKLQEDTYTGDPLTEKGKEIMKAMKEQYGEEKGEQIFYASKNKGSISGVDSKTKDEGVSLQTYRGKTFGITKKNGMFEAIFLFEENHVKAPSEQEAINKAKEKIDQFLKIE